MNMCSLTMVRSIIWVMGTVLNPILVVTYMVQDIMRNPIMAQSIMWAMSKDLCIIRVTHKALNIPMVWSINLAIPSMHSIMAD